MPFAATARAFLVFLGGAIFLLSFIADRQTKLGDDRLYKIRKMSHSVVDVRLVSRAAPTCAPNADACTRNSPKKQLESHPTVKPIALVADAMLDCTKRNDIVIDPYHGSGTTILAAERTGRRCHAIEIDGRYVDTAIKRWEQLTKQEAKDINGKTFAQTISDRGADQ